MTAMMMSLLSGDRTPASDVFVCERATRRVSVSREPL